MTSKQKSRYIQNDLNLFILVSESREWASLMCEKILNTFLLPNDKNDTITIFEEKTSE